MSYKLKTAVLLVGGQGSRLRPYTDDKPKPLVEIGGKSILEWNTSWLRHYGIEHLVLGCGPKKDKIEDFITSKNNLGFSSVHYSENSSQGGTAEAFRLAIERYVDDENYLAMNGDELTNLDLDHMMNDHYNKSAVVTMALVPFKAPYSIAELDNTGMIRGFTYGKALRDKPISIGIYIFNNRINDLIPHNGSIEQSVFTKLAHEGKMASYMLYSGEEWATVNDHKQKIEAEEALKRWGLLKE